MRVDLFLILFLQAEEHLHRGVALLDVDYALLDLEGHLRRVLKMALVG